MVVKYLVDEEKYNLYKHKIFLSTTEYSYKTTTLTKQTINQDSVNTINKCINNTDYMSFRPEQIRYYVSKSNNSKCMQIDQSAFFNMYNEFSQDEVEIMQETCERYQFSNKNGVAASVTIAVVREKNKQTWATVEFKSNKEMADFVLPKWIYSRN